ncbi:MAG TPA: efflux RND transporter periplasmic adaptor subunit [Caulobacteraceae bacterium]|jgi:HlyD family secretion protein
MTTTNWRIAAAAALGLALAACHPPASGGGGATAQQEQGREVSVVRIDPRPISGGIVTSGLLAPRNQVAVSPDLSGYRVAKLFAEEGDWVRAGQPLAEMDASIIRAQVDQQLALAAQQKANADQRQKEAARVVGLDTEGVLPTEQLQARRFAASGAAAAANAAAASAREMQIRLEHLTLRAPVAGLVLQRNVNLGDISGGGANPWFVMADGGEVELFADVAEADFDKMRTGLKATVTLADNTQVDGYVRLVSPRIDANTRLGKVRISLPVRPDIRAGGYARASFIDVSRAVLAVPETAVRYDANGASVMVVGSDGKVSQVTVTTGDRGGGYVELLTGPPSGTIVVAKAGAQLLPGDYVKYVKPDAPKAPAPKAPAP